MRILSVASEVYPLIKTGGLADVAGALPPAMARRGIEMRTLLPGYRAVMKNLTRPRVVHEFTALFGAPARLIAAEAEGLSAARARRAAALRPPRRALPRA